MNPPTNLLKHHLLCRLLSQVVDPPANLLKHHLLCRLLSRVVNPPANLLKHHLVNRVVNLRQNHLLSPPANLAVNPQANLLKHHLVNRVVNLRQNHLLSPPANLAVNHLAYRLRTQQNTRLQNFKQLCGIHDGSLGPRDACKSVLLFLYSTFAFAPILTFLLGQQLPMMFSIDGQEPEYMLLNPSEWLSTTLQKCCKKHFNNYYYDQCLFQHPPPALQGCSDPLLFYPDWEGQNTGCVDDGKYKLLHIECTYLFIFMCT